MLHRTTPLALISFLSLVALGATLAACGDDSTEDGAGGTTASGGDSGGGSSEGTGGDASTSSTGTPASGTTTSVSSTSTEGAGAGSGDGGAGGEDPSGSTGGSGAGGNDELLPAFEGPGCIAHTVWPENQLWLRGDCAPGGAVQLNTDDFEEVDDTTDQLLSWSLDGRYLSWYGFDIIDPIAQHIVRVDEDGVGPIVDVGLGSWFMPGGLMNASWDALSFQTLDGDELGEAQTLFTQPFVDGSIDAIYASPDGNRMAVAYSNYNVAPEDMVANVVVFDGTSGEWVEQLELVGGIVYFSPDSSSMVVGINGGQWVDFVDLTADAPVAEPLGALYPWEVEWAPDSSAVAFPTYDGEVMTQQVSPAVGEAVEVGGGNRVYTADHFRWSPDSQRLAMIFGYDVEGAEGLFLAERDGGAPTLVADMPSTFSWSPDGDTIVFQSWDTDLYAVDVSGDVPAAPMKINVGCTVPNINLVDMYDRRHEWSPDGSTLAFVCQPDGSRDRDLFVAPASNLLDQTSLTAPELTGQGYIAPITPWFFGDHTLFITWSAHDDDPSFLRIIADLDTGSKTSFIGENWTPRPIGW